MTAVLPLALQIPTKRQNAEAVRADLNGDAPDCSHRVRYWRRTVAIGDFTAAAALTQEIDLYADLTADALGRLEQSGDFPGPVWMNVAPPYVRTIVDFAGGGAASVTAAVGDTGDPDGLVTASSVFTGVAPSVIWTPAALEYAARYESAFVPTLTLTSDVNINLLTAGKLEVVIAYIPKLKDVD